MSDVIISVENLSKRYFVGHRSAQRERYTALRDVIVREARNFARKADDLLHGRQIVQGDEIEEFWALQDVNFEVEKGDVLGIIGRNGAGKSTLLKVLSRITEPTKGRVRIRGRVGSLLEVGTGFHPELTGRENIYLNGAILGMSFAEIRRKFDEIVSFAEVEKFLDTPVKHYSSGMYMRLAFAVAAHLEPEILIVDEVLAVGDAEFQKKCLGKLSEVAGDGRTVLFVSHNIGAVRKLCNKAIFLKNGVLEPTTTVDDAIDKYFLSTQVEESKFFELKDDEPGFRYVSVDGDRLREGDFVIEMAFQSPFALRPPIPGFVIYSTFGEPLLSTNTIIHPNGLEPNSFSNGVARAHIKGLQLKPGTYWLSVWLGDQFRDYFVGHHALRFDWKGGQGAMVAIRGGDVGVMDAPVEWTVTEGELADEAAL